MRVINPKIIANRNNELDIKFSNGMREFIATLNKANIKFDHIKNNEVYVKVYAMIRNCCTASPLYVLESGKNKEDDLEIKELITIFIELIGEEIEKIL